MNKSFTLIEILVVIVIVGILSAFIIVGMAGVSEKAAIAKGQAFAGSLKNSLLLNLVSEWKLDQVNIPAVNQTPDDWSANNCTLVGPSGSQNLPQLQTSGCVSGNCFLFDGTDDYLNCGTGANLNIRDAITIEAWVKEVSHKNFAGIVEKGDKYVVLSRSSSPFSYYFILRDVDAGNNYANMVSAVPLEQWAHLVATWTKGSAMKMYLNGVLDVTGDVCNKQIADTAGGPLRIGEFNSSSYAFNGFIDNVRIYSEAVPVSQIQQSYYAGLIRLLFNKGISFEEYQQRLGELKSYLVKK